MIEPFDHPDLRDVGRLLRRQFDAVTEAEQHATDILIRRTTTLRDRMIEAEDRGSDVEIELIGGSRYRGRVLAASVDHIEIAGHDHTTLVPIEAIIAISY